MRSSEITQWKVCLPFLYPSSSTPPLHVHSAIISFFTNLTEISSASETMVLTVHICNTWTGPKAEGALAVLHTDQGKPWPGSDAHHFHDSLISQSSHMTPLTTREPATQSYHLSGSEKSRDAWRTAALTWGHQGLEEPESTAFSEDSEPDRNSPVTVSWISLLLRTRPHLSHGSTYS